MSSATGLGLSVALTDNARTRPVLDGRVHAGDYQLTATALNAGEMFWRQLKFREFDVSEMSISTLAIAKARGDVDWIALPIFTHRQFFHTGILVNAEAGISRPEDLRGKRVGVSEFQQTSVVWIRGILEDEFGVDPHDLDWVMERSPEKSHGATTGFTPPPGIRLSFVQGDRDLNALLLAGEIDALLFMVAGGTMLDRERTDLRNSPLVRPLFEDPQAEARRYFLKTRCSPMNHCVVVRRSIAQADREIGPALFRMFLAAKELARAESGDAPRLANEDDPLAYGLRATTPALETLLAYIQRSGLTERRVHVDELFDMRLE